DVVAVFEQILERLEAAAVLKNHCLIRVIDHQLHHRVSVDKDCIEVEGPQEHTVRWQHHSRSLLPCNGAKRGVLEHEVAEACAIREVSNDELQI
ncbi:hypothetical protein PENTCL1PPCAC_21301, partial [Pristionchus entomophagus]